MKPQQIASVVTPAAPLRVCHHKQSLRKALGITSNLSEQRHFSGAYLRFIASSREHAVPGRAAESNHSVDMPVAHPLAAFGRARSLRILWPNPL